MIAIKHHFSGTTLCEFDVNTIKEAAEKGKADLRGANLREADLSWADLRWADLRGADLRGADLRGADLCGANLREADLRGANLCGANLRGADLRGANLCGANLREADLRGANLRGANLREADLGEKYGKLQEKGFFQASPLGSREDWLLAFHTDKGIFVRAGCFFDSLELFREKVIVTHGENSKHGKLYLGIANVIEFKFLSE